jgi:two-component system OmpR family sensor kinase
MSIRLRIVVATLALTLLGLTAAGFLTYRLVEDFLVDRLDDQLVRESGRALVISSTVAPEGAAPPPGLEKPVLLTSGAYFERRTVNGQVLGTDNYDEGNSAPIIPSEIDPVRQWFSVNSTNGGPEYRVYVSPVGSTGDVGIFALPMTDVDATLQRLVWIELGVFAGVLAIMGALVFFVVRIGLRPLNEVVETADAIAAGDLSRRAPDTNSRNEVGRLSAAFNAMIGAIESSFGRQRAAEQRLRAFVADASHELRTPLTPMRGYAEMLEGSALSEEDRRFAAARISEASTRMTRLVDDMLLLARMDEAPNLIESQVDLRELAHGAVADARAAAPNREFDLDAENPVWVKGDRDHLARVIANLLTNVRMHTADSVLAQVVVKTEDERAIIEVRDTGPGIPPALQSQLFDRFYRGDKSRSRASGGSGLGLSIVASIVEVHNGILSVESDGQLGTVFRISLPLSVSEPLVFTVTELNPEIAASLPELSEPALSLGA